MKLSVTSFYVLLPSDGIKNKCLKLLTLSEFFYRLGQGYSCNHKEGYVEFRMYYILFLIFNKRIE